MALLDYEYTKLIEFLGNIMSKEDIVVRRMVTFNVSKHVVEIVINYPHKLNFNFVLPMDIFKNPKMMKIYNKEENIETVLIRDDLSLPSAQLGYDLYNDEHKSETLFYYDKEIDQTHAIRQAYGSTYSKYGQGYYITSNCQQSAYDLERFVTLEEEQEIFTYIFNTLRQIHEHFLSDR